MQSDLEFRRALDDIKARAPIEEIVGERVNLVSRGRLLWACCPFHDEKTPSFKIDPAAGTWYCFGACSKGGDVVQFLIEADGVGFMDAVEILASRTGVELPRRKRERSASDDRGLAALAFADTWYQRQLFGPGGREARAYLERRGVERSAIEAFGLGFAPAGRAFLEAARAEGIRFEDLERTGLARRGDDGSPYAFFRGRLTIPIRDLRGQTVAFGARRLIDGDAGGPKYVNTPETPYFHKGRVVYALDRAIASVRRSGHLVLVEGYTDVIAAHQAGLATVAAVLGTATTRDHAQLVKRAGARRISLVFDGDEAGRQAAYRGIEGLLGLEAELEVVVLPAGQDPADVLAHGADAFQARLDGGLPWLEFVTGGLADLGGRELSREVDRVLALIGELRRPVEREAALREVAARTEIPLTTLRGQLETLPARLRSSRAPAAQGAGVAAARAAANVEQGQENDSNEANRPVDHSVIRAYEGVVGAALVDPSLSPTLRPHVEGCPVRDLRRLLEAILEIWDDETLDDDETIDECAVMARLADDPARRHVVPLAENARKADDARGLLEGNLRYLVEHRRKASVEALQARIRKAQAAANDARRRGDEDTVTRAEEYSARCVAKLTELLTGGAA